MGSRKSSRMLLPPRPVMDVSGGWFDPLSDEEKSELRAGLENILPRSRGATEQNERFVLSAFMALAQFKGSVKSLRKAQSKHPAHDLDKKFSRERIGAVMKAAGAFADSIAKLDTSERDLLLDALFLSAQEELALGKEYHAQDSSIHPLCLIHSNTGRFPDWFDGQNKPLDIPGFDAIDRAAAVARRLYESDAFIPKPALKRGRRKTEDLQILILQMAHAYACLFCERPSKFHGGVFCNALEEILKYAGEKLPSERWLGEFFEELNLRAPAPKPGPKT